jgi:hypothetical protein
VIFQQFVNEESGCLSYLIGCGDAGRAVAMKARVLGGAHPDVAVSLTNLAVIVASRDELSEAESLYRRAMEIFEAALGPAHPHTLACRENHAKLSARRSTPAGVE